MTLVGVVVVADTTPVSDSSSALPDAAWIVVCIHQDLRDTPDSASGRHRDRRGGPPCPDRQRLRVLRRPHVGDARDRRGRPARRRHRRLPRRTHDADPVEGQAQGLLGRVRPDLPHPVGYRSWHGARPRDPDRHQRRRPEPHRPGRADRRAGRPARPGAEGGLPRRRRPHRAARRAARRRPRPDPPGHRPVAARGRHRAGDGQRLPRRVGIAAALAEDADVVVCPAAWWHGWSHTDYDALAGAVAAGHVIECGPQATGGNYPWPEEIRHPSHPGFPIAEVEADGSSVITKHPGTGGLVSVGTVTAQLLYEIAGPGYANPDVVAHFDTIELGQQDTDRVRISGTRGSAPSGMLKVAIDYIGGYRNTMTLVLTGLDIEGKAAA